MLDGSILDVSAVHEAREALEAARAQADRLSRTDPLTGVANRRALPERLSALCRDGAGLLLVDVDHFKQVNDFHGHRAGDAVLVELARRLRRRVRADDDVVRMGGEEFLVLLPGITHEVPAARARRGVARRDRPAGLLRGRDDLADRLGRRRAGRRGVRPRHAARRRRRRALRGQAPRAQPRRARPARPARPRGGPGGVGRAADRPGLRRRAGARGRPAGAHRRRRRLGRRDRARARPGPRRDRPLASGRARPRARAPAHRPRRARVRRGRPGRRARRRRPGAGRARPRRRPSPDRFDGAEGRPAGAAIPIESRIVAAAVAWVEDGSAAALEAQAEEGALDPEVVRALLLEVSAGDAATAVPA